MTESDNKQPQARIAGIVLAAGAARRYGSAKQLVEIDGHPMIRKTVLAAVEGGLEPLVVVVGARADAIAAAVENVPSVRVVQNESFADGLSTSIAAGLEALEQGERWKLGAHDGRVPETASVDGVAFLTSDQPGVDSTLIRLVAAEFRPGASSIVRPTSGAIAGHPVIFDVCYVPELLALQGDVGGAEVIARHRAMLHEVTISDPKQLMDVDRPEDLDNRDFR